MSSSSVISAIKTTKIGQQPNHVSSLTTVKITQEQSPSYYVGWEMLDEVRIDVNVGSTILLESGYPPETLKFARASVERAIINELYGDVRDKLIKLSIEMQRRGIGAAGPHGHGDLLDRVEQLIKMVSYEKT